MPVEEEEISKELARVFKKRGIDVNTGAKVEKVERTEAGVKVSYTDANGKPEVKEAEKVLIAVGRAGRTENIGIEKTKVELERGPVKVNGEQQTAEPVDLCHRRHRFRLSATGPRRLNGRHGRRCQDRGCKIPPAESRSNPKLHLYRATGRFSWTHRSAGQGKRLRGEGRQVPLRRQLKATIVGSHDGFVKIVSDAKYGEILGVHIIGPQATEIIAEAVTVLELEGTVEEMMYTIHAHPTLSESMLDAYGAVEGMAINA